MNKKWQNRLYQLLQVVVFTASVIFLFKVTQDNIQPLKDLVIQNWTVAGLNLILTIVIYVLLMALLALAWMRLNQSKRQPIGAIYLKSQALKYLPGNVFHFVYRHVESERLGIGRKQLIIASVQETIWLVFCCLLVAVTLALTLQESLPLLIDLSVLLWSAMAALLVFAIVLLKYFKLRKWLVYVVLYSSYFLGMGLIAVCVAKGLGIAMYDYPLITAVYALAWVVGYLVPGAPGGLGVRESVFIMILGDAYQMHEVIAIIAAIRLISVAAEVLLYLAAKPLSAVLSHFLHLIDRITP